MEFWSSVGGWSILLLHDDGLVALGWAAAATFSLADNDVCSDSPMDYCVRRWYEESLTRGAIDWMEFGVDGWVSASNHAVEFLSVRASCLDQ